MRIYHYLGAVELKQPSSALSHRLCLTNIQQLRNWINLIIKPASDNARLTKVIEITATFIIDLHEQIWINDRHSEHVVCANGEPVLAAGEITFQQNGDAVIVSEITNQSTGYCPEPECWPIVDRVLTRLSIDHPDNFTGKFIFRFCESCGNKNIVKDDWYHCAICDAPLSREWNFAEKS